MIGDIVFCFASLMIVIYALDSFFHLGIFEKIVNQLEK